MEKQNKEKMPDVSREDWNVEQLTAEASNELPDDMLRRVLREDEGKGSPDERDYVGKADSNETPQGREEAKNDAGSKANING